MHISKSSKKPQIYLSPSRLLDKVELGVVLPLFDLRHRPGLLLGGRLAVHHVREEALAEDLLRGEERGQLLRHLRRQVGGRAEVGLAQHRVQEVAVLESEHKRSGLLALLGKAFFSFTGGHRKIPFEFSEPCEAHFVV